MLNFLTHDVDLRASHAIDHVTRVARLVGAAQKLGALRDLTFICGHIHLTIGVSRKFCLPRRLGLHPRLQRRLVSLPLALASFNATRQPLSVTRLPQVENATVGQIPVVLAAIPVAGCI